MNKSTASSSKAKYEYLTKLFILLKDSFDEEELNSLCFHLGIEYSDLSASNRAGKIRELVKLLDRERRLSDLIRLARKLRPNKDWQNPTTLTEEALAFFVADGAPSKEVQHIEQQWQFEQSPVGQVVGKVSGDVVHGVKISASVIGIVVLVIVAIAIMLFFMFRDSQSSQIEPQMASPISTATPNELLIILAPYAGDIKEIAVYPAQDLLDSWQAKLEISSESIRLELWPESITSRQQAREVGEMYQAALVVWGRKDDIAGIRTFVEIIPELPQIIVEENNQILPLRPVSLSYMQLYQLPRDCIGSDAELHTEYQLWLLWGLAQLAANQKLSAATHFETAISMISNSEACSINSIQAYFWQGYLKGTQQQYSQALKALNYALEIETDFHQARSVRGIIFVAQGDLEQARIDFEKATEISSTTASYSEIGGDQARQADIATTFGNQGVVAQQDGRFQDATTLYQKASTSQPQSPTTQLQDLERRGNLAYTQQNYGEAQILYQEALTLTRTLGDQQAEGVILGNLGLVVLREGKYEEAEAIFQTALGINQEIGYEAGVAQQQLLLGTVKLFHGRQTNPSENFEQAIAYFSEARRQFIALDLPYSHAKANIGIWLVEKEREATATALPFLEEALSLLEKIESPYAATVRQEIDINNQQQSALTFMIS